MSMEVGTEIQKIIEGRKMIQMHDKMQKKQANTSGKRGKKIKRKTQRKQS